MRTDVALVVLGEGMLIHLTGWLLFFLSAAILLAILYLPGAVCLSRFSAPAGLNAALAPSISLAVLAVTMTLFSALGLHAHWYWYILLLLAICVIGACVNRTYLQAKISGLSKIDVMSFFLYTGIATFLVCLIYVKSLDGPNSFIPLFDCVSTLSTIRQFSSTELYSPFFPAIYADLPQLNQGASYYPAALHSVAALLVNATGCGVAESLNIVIFVALVAVLPLSIRVFIKAVFPENRAVELFGSIAPYCFFAFPWGMLIWGPLQTNLVAFIFIPAFIAALVYALEGPKRFLWVYVIVAALTLAILHPGALFAAGVLASPVLVLSFSKYAGRRVEGPHKAWAVLGGAFLSVTIICLVWVACFNLPPLRGTVSYTWPAFYTPSEAISAIIGLSFADSPAQLVACALVLIGIIFCVKRNEKGSWLLLSAFLVGVIYYVDVTMDGPIKQLLGGFWYTDSKRIAAMLVIPLMPLFAYGLATVYSAAKTFFSAKKETSARQLSGFAPLCVVLILAISAYGPAISLYGSFTIPSPISQVRANLTTLNDLSGLTHRDGNREVLMIDREELEAGSDILELIGDDDSVILNNPFDGSAFFYGVYNLNVLNRACFALNDYRNLYLQVNEYTWNNDVKDTLQSVGVRYLLQLDVTNGQFDAISSFEPNYAPENWVGIQSVNSSTPGFELIYSKGDIRLYRLTDL